MTTPHHSRFGRGLRLLLSSIRSNRFVFWGILTILILGLATFIHPILMGWIWPTGVYDPPYRL